MDRSSDNRRRLGRVRKLLVNSTPPPTSHQQVPEAVAEQLVADVTQAITGWIDRTREHGLRIPFVSDLLERLIRPGA